MPLDGESAMRFEAIDDEGNRLTLPVSNFPSYLKRKRKKAGLSLQAVATEFEVVRQAVWSWEQGRAMPTLERLADIVRFFDRVLGVEKPKKDDRLKKLAHAEDILGV